MPACGAVSSGDGASAGSGCVSLAKFQTLLAYCIIATGLSGVIEQFSGLVVCVEASSEGRGVGVGGTDKDRGLRG